MKDTNIRQTITRNLNELMEKNRIRAIDLAEAVGVSKSAVSHWLAGDNSPNIEVLAKICQVYGVKMSEMLNDRTELSPAEKQHIKKYRSLDHYGRKAVDSLMDIELERCSVVVELPRLITLPMADLPASAGTGQWLDENGHFEDIDVIDTPQARTANIIIKVSGDSMEPLFHDGDALLVQRQDRMEQGEIGVFIIDGCGYIKKLGHNELISVNPEYNNITLTSDNAAVCFGKVVGLAQFPK